MMAARLGEVLYWVFFILAALVLLMVWNGGRLADPGLEILIAVLLWALGYACRYVLAGR